jgi:CRISPR system Cascade subunit CasE
MNLMQITLDARSMFEWAHPKGFAGDQDYSIHAATRAAFGSLGPQPWAKRPAAAGNMIVLGYGDASAAELRQTLDKADSALRPAIRDVRTKELPFLPVGGRYRFEVRVCPVRRGDGHERDIAIGASASDRAAIYRRWLERKVEGAATVLDCGLTQFQLVHAYRHGASGPVHRIRGWYTDATLAGLLEVTDADAFQAALEGGIGRHKIAGYGMILLRRPR